MTRNIFIRNRNRISNVLVINYYSNNGVIIKLEIKINFLSEK